MRKINIEDGQELLSTLVAGTRDRRLALATILVSLTLFVAAASFAKLPLTPVPAFISIYEAILIINDLITSVLLLGQFRILRSRALLTLACAYLFTALMTVAHALTFPGLFVPTGLLGAGPQSTAWLYVFWHAGFPLFVIVYALLKDDRDARLRLTDGRAMLLVIGLAVMLAGSVTFLATAA